MTLSELIIQHRKEYSLSQRQFAERCGVSNGYISMLEKGVNPSTGEPIQPTIPRLQAIATGMNMTLDQLFKTVDDIPVSLELKDLPTETERQIEELTSLFLKFTEEERAFLIRQLRSVVKNI